MRNNQPISGPLTPMTSVPTSLLNRFMRHTACHAEQHLDSGVGSPLRSRDQAFDRMQVRMPMHRTWSAPYWSLVPPGKLTMNGSKHFGWALTGMVGMCSVGSWQCRHQAWGVGFTAVLISLFIGILLGSMGWLPRRLGRCSNQLVGYRSSGPYRHC